jgi:rhodanese-related sulfurtransferase
MADDISVGELRELLQTAGDDIALMDVRETAEYNLAHIGGAVSLPRRLIEYRLQALVPFTATRIAVCDDDGRRAALAAATMEAMGYTGVSVLEGGLNRWVTDGGPTEWGVNVPSKDFGERLLLQKGVPEIQPDELHERMRRGDKLLILDSRTPEEHHRACIPGSRSMPGAELGLRAWELIEPDTTVIVHCAGRTRSIVGAGTLQRLGVDDVFCLKNGTMGWQLAGLTLETGSDRVALPQPSAENAARAEKLAREVAAAEGVRVIGAHELERLFARTATENVYRFDVRTREEYVSGHLPGFRWAPGGQLVQATDSYIAVKSGTTVLACDGFVRAGMTAAWLRQMGHANVYVLEGGTSAWTAAGRSLEAGAEDPYPFGYAAGLAQARLVSPAGLARSLQEAPSVLFIGTSDEFAEAHVPGSRWLSRSWLELRITEVAPVKHAPLVVTCAGGVGSVLAAATLRDLGYSDVSVLEGGLAAWRLEGLPVETGLTGVTQAPDDVLPVRRSYAEMLNYLRWEEELGHRYEHAAR